MAIRDHIPGDSRGEAGHLGEVERLREERDQLAAKLHEMTCANQRLLENEAMFREIVTHSDDIVFVVDPAGRFVWMNPTGIDAMGLPGEQVVGMTKGDLFAGEMGETLERQDRQVMESGTTQVFRHTLRIGGTDRTFHTTKYPYRSATGAVIGTIGIARDITAAAALEEALRANERRLRDIVESSTNLFYIHDADHILTYLSPHAQAFFECDAGEALVNWTDFVTDHPVNQAGFAATTRAIETGERQPPYELELIGKKHRKIWVEVREAPLVRDGKTVALTGSLTDITERKRMEEALRAQNEQLLELDRLKSSFVGSVSHEIRTPLTTITGYADFLDEEVGGPLTETQRRYVAAIREGATRLERIVDDLLDYARLESGAFRLRPRPANLAQKVLEVVDSLRPQALAADLTLTASVPEAPVTLCADIDRLGQVMLNLVGNAIKFTPPGGTVEVTLLDAGDALHLAVKDSGIGIPPDAHDRIFEKFYQVDPSSTRARGGAGHGLAISKALVEAQGGEIVLESAPGTGSTFRVTLRRSALGAGTAAAERPDGRPGPR